jgi:hypothetical protein
MARWWFRFVFSGRFLETFIVGPAGRVSPPSGQTSEPASAQQDQPAPVNEAVTAKIPE